VKTPVFTGASTAIITPFRDGKVDYAALAKILHMQKIAGTAAITVCGTTGEAATMTENERKSVISFCVRHSDGMKIIAGAGTNDTRTTLDLSMEAEDAGADAVLLVTPYYNKPTQAGLIEHYSYVADRLTVPVILYNVPSRTGVSISSESCIALAQHPNINGIKEASGSFNLLSKILADCDKDFTVWSGNDDLTVPMMALGAKGVISVAGNIVPSVMTQLTDLCLANRFDEAAKIHLRYHPLFSALFMETNPIPVKTAMAAMGLCTDEFRSPLCRMTENNKSKLINILNSFGLV
jgi:4-hydroxy-tetrahydrodipicolinate synthase